MTCNWCDWHDGRHQHGCLADLARDAFLAYRIARGQAVRIGGDVARIDQAYQDRMRELRAQRQVRVPTPRPRRRHNWLGTAVLAVGSLAAALGAFGAIWAFAWLVGKLGAL